MPLIMGIGDEVVHFAAAVLLAAVAAVAWWSTNARPDRYRAVILRPFRYHPDTLTVRPGDTPMTLQYTNAETLQDAARIAQTPRDPPAAESRQTDSSERDVVPLQEMDSIVDAHMALLDNNRLHFYRRVQSLRTVQVAAESTVDAAADTQEEPEPASNAQIREMDSIVSAMEADETTNCDVFSRPNGNDSESNQVFSECQPEPVEKDTHNPDENSAEGDNTATGNTVDVVQRKILIRLKYLNDTLKEVEGSLDELLKDFKWRHFSNELSSSYRVRLIFNGRVLGDEGATLRALGLYHRAVVHCLVHPRRAAPQRGSRDEPAPRPILETGRGARAAPERAWDLENILMTLVSVALTVVWFFRCEYSNMFTASASVALFGLTVFYSIAIFGLYLSDTFHFDRRPQPAPHN